MFKENRYATKAEFIREAIRDKMNDLETKAALRRLQAAYGAGKKTRRKITDEDVRKAKDEAFIELAKKMGINLD